MAVALYCRGFYWKKQQWLWRVWFGAYIAPRKQSGGWRPYQWSSWTSLRRTLSYHQGLAQAMNQNRPKKQTRRQHFKPSNQQCTRTNLLGIFRGTENHGLKLCSTVLLAHLPCFWTYSNKFCLGLAGWEIGLHRLLRFCASHLFAHMPFHCRAIL